MQTLYRSGNITPLQDITNLSAEHFQNAIMEHGGENIHRTESVFASLDLNDVLYCWCDWREDKELDKDVYSITLPEGVDGVYAYKIDHYDEYWFAMAQKRHEDAAEHAMAYFTDRVNIHDWGNIENPQDYEVLIPHFIAEESAWVNLG